ncbi:MAG TPA: hypothetical protein VED63_07395 [Acidimicrobiales bacterium]|nr:hypothetical protein [Acidimicrobiales bacterium]
MDDKCPNCHSSLKVSPDFVVGMDYAGSIYPTTMVCVDCAVLWGCREGGGLVSVFAAQDAYANSPSAVSSARPGS